MTITVYDLPQLHHEGFGHPGACYHEELCTIHAIGS